jgi:uncharacterized RDD family membrane protein YckC
VVVGYEIAGVGTRLLAQVIDLGILSLVVLSGMAALSALSVVFDVVAVTALIIFASVIPFAYFLVPEARRGATIGKRALGIRVVTDDGAPIGWRESAIRNLLRLIDFLPGLYVLGGIVAIASPRGKRLGDMAAGTVTVRVGGDDEDRFAAATTFTQAVGEIHAGPVPPELAAILARYRRRHEELLPEARRDLAERLAVRLEPYHPRPDGMSLEEYVVRAAVTYAPTRRG